MWQNQNIAHLDFSMQLVFIKNKGKYIQITFSVLQLKACHSSKLCFLLTLQPRSASTPALLMI